MNNLLKPSICLLMAAFSVGVLASDDQTTQQDKIPIPPVSTCTSSWSKTAGLDNKNIIAILSAENKAEKFTLLTGMNKKRPPAVSRDKFPVTTLINTFKDQYQACQVFKASEEFEKLSDSGKRMLARELHTNLLHANESVRLIEKSLIVLKQVKGDTETLSDTNVFYIQRNLHELKEIILPYWLASSDYHAYLSKEERQFLIDNLPITETAILKEAMKLESKLADNENKKELDRLFKKSLSSSLSPAEKSRLDELISSVKSPEVTGGQSLSLFKDYPQVISRFYMGAEAQTDSNFEFELLPTIGYFHYRRPTKGSCIHSITDVALKTEQSIDETDESSEVEYSGYVDYTLFFGGNSTKNIGSQPLYHGLVLGGVLNAFENKEDVTNTKLTLKKDALIGYRWAYSPEQYTQVGLTNRLTVGEDDDVKSYVRGRIDFQVLAGLFEEDSDMQLGLQIGLKLDENDTEDNSITVNAKWVTSFGELFSDIQQY